MRRPGLRSRFRAAISALVAAVILGQTAVLAFFARRHVREEITRRGLSYARLAAEPIAAAYSRYGASGVTKLHEVVRRTAELDPDLRALAIYDAEGELLFHSDELELGERPPNLIFLGDARKRPLETPIGLEPVTGDVDYDGEVFYEVLVPRLEDWGAFRYAVAFYFSYDDLHAAMCAMAWRIAFVGLAALALGLACARLLSAQSLVPLESLTSGARRLAEGDLGHRVGLATGDEFEVLSRTLDRMAERLRTTISDLASSNEELTRANEELAELDRVKSDLLANVSHELRTPLTAVSGYVEAMQEGLLGELDSGQAEALEIVERNLDRLRGTIEQLLDSSRLESGRREVELAPFDLEAVVRQVAEALSAARGPNLDLRCEVPPGLPEVYGDAAGISQVIENLLTNAVKFSPAGSPVILEAREVPHGVEVAVRDRGIGIAEEDQAKVFDRFFQVDASSRRRFGGMGLGLAIVREVLALHGSEIRLESRLGEGSTFRFVLSAAAGRTDKIAALNGPRAAFVDGGGGR